MTASLVQLIVPDHLRGRVVSIYMVAFRGGMPLGSLRGRLRRDPQLRALRPRRQRRARLARRAVFPDEESWGEGAVIRGFPPSRCALRRASGARRVLRSDSVLATISVSR